MSTDQRAEPPDGVPADGSDSEEGVALTGRTAWARNLAAPVRDYLSTETGSAVVLLGAAVAALLWANSPWSGSYESFWATKLAVSIGDTGISMDLRQWVNEGLMTFFFLVVGLEVGSRPSASSTWGSYASGGASRSR